MTRLILCQSESFSSSSLSSRKHQILYPGTHFLAVGRHATFPVSSSASLGAVLPNLCYSWHILKMIIFAWHFRVDGQSWSQLEVAALRAPVPSRSSQRLRTSVSHTYSQPSHILVLHPGLSILSALKKSYSLSPQHLYFPISYTPNLSLSVSPSPSTPSDKRWESKSSTASPPQWNSQGLISGARMGT